MNLDVVAPRLSVIGDYAFERRGTRKAGSCEFGGRVVIRGSLRRDLQVAERAFDHFRAIKPADENMRFEHRDCSSLPLRILRSCHMPCGDGEFADASFSSKYLHIPGRPDLALFELSSQQQQLSTRG